MSPSNGRRVAVTGLGAITPCGTDLPATWRAVLEGRSGVGRIAAFDAAGMDVRVAGEVRGLDEHPMMAAKRVRSLSRAIQFALIASNEALEDSGLDVSGDPERTGVLIGTGMGGVGVVAEQAVRTLEDGTRVRPRDLPNAIPNMPAGAVGMMAGAKGPNFSVSSACATGAHALGEAAEWIRRGDADSVLAGGTEALVFPLAIEAFDATGAMSHRNQDPAGASRPFDRGRDGFVMSEGSAVVVLEELESARARGARIYSELSGYAATADAFHPTRPDGDGARRCVELALARARCKPGDLGYVNAHGTATRLNDSTEAATYQAVFGPDRHRVPVSSTKGATGHMLGAAGSLEAALTARALHDGLLPPTVNLDDVDPECEDLHHVRGQAREARPTAALSSSFGFGGQNACLVLTDPHHH